MILSLRGTHPETLAKRRKLDGVIPSSELHLFGIEYSERNDDKAIVRDLSGSYTIAELESILSQMKLAETALFGEKKS